MAPSRRLRRWLSGALGAAILFTQLAVAAYVCPPSDPAKAGAIAMAGMPDCHETEVETEVGQSPLCKAHCANEAQSSVRTGAPDLQPNPASVALLQRIVEPPAAAYFALPDARATPWADPPDPLPRYLSLLVLRN